MRRKHSGRRRNFGSEAAKNDGERVMWKHRLGWMSEGLGDPIHKSRIWNDFLKSAFFKSDIFGHFGTWKEVNARRVIRDPPNFYSVVKEPAGRNTTNPRRAPTRAPRNHTIVLAARGVGINPNFPPPPNPKPPLGLCRGEGNPFRSGIRRRRDDCIYYDRIKGCHRIKGDGPFICWTLYLLFICSL
jgi:hypothetical protein